MAHRPRTRDDLLKLRGIERAKAEQYDAEVLALLTLNPLQGVSERPPRPGSPVR